ncbi:MAG: class I SAM-dependent methyltransferase [Planctomycetes bacterium]|nr:class I SAM-dependent methyltransferase [Planctomycetota bacterium]
MTSYGELCTEFYDLDKPVAPELALEWYGSALAGAGRTLEPMCGSGRFLVPLLRRGLRIDGFDPSRPMLQACRTKLAAAGLETGLWLQSLEALDLPVREYDAAFIPASSFCLIVDRDAARQALLRLRAHLAARAVVLIEFELPQAGADWPRETARTVTVGGRQIRLASRVQYDPDEQLETYTNVYELRQSGRVTRTEHEVLRLRCYSPDAMRTELEGAGFHDVGIEHPEFGWVANARA